MVRVRLLRFAFLALALLGAIPHAQALDPTSRQNVVPTAAAAGSADLEARRKALFARMITNPADLDVAFAYAAVSAQLGDLEGAISTLERMLIFAPGLSRLQYELGVLYYRLGAYETAATYLRAVEAAGDVPAAAKAEAAAYLAAIDRRTAGNAVSGSISAGLRYQTNANAGPASPLINLNGLTLTLAPTAVGQPDTNAYLGGTLDAAIDLQNQGDRLRLSVTGYGTFYRTQGALNSGILEFKAGPDFNLGRFGIENGKAGIYGIAGAAMAGGAPYYVAAGLGGDVVLDIGARSRLTLRTEARNETYFNSILRPTAGLRSGPDISGTATFQYALTPDLNVFVTAGLNRHLGQTPWQRSWQATGEIGASLSFASPIEALPAPWTVAAVAGVQQQMGDGPDPMFSPVAAETTTRLYLQGKLTVPLPNGFAVEGVAAYVHSISNYPLSTYDNLAVSLGVRKAF